MHQIDFGLHTGAYIQRPHEIGLKGQVVGPCYVGSKDKVSRLSTVSEDRAFFPTDQTATEDRHDPRFSMWILPGAVDVRVA